MGCLTLHNYRALQKRMDRSIPGIYDSVTLYELLRILFTDEEAKLCSIMPLTYFTLNDISRIWHKDENQANEVLADLINKGLVYFDESTDEKYFWLAPAVLGFFEFSMMRTDGKFDREQLSKLYYKYNNIEDGFMKQFSSINPPMTRIFVQEDSIKDIKAEVLSYEKASAGIDQSSCITVGTCFCRHKMEHMGMACDNPQDTCLTFNGVAKDLASQGIAREISKSEAHDILNLCIQKGLVQIGDNKKDELVVICNCCGCCCDILSAYKRFGATSLINPTNYISVIEREKCSGCGICVERCPVDARSIQYGKAVVNEKICLGCGVCRRFCPTEASGMEARAEKVFVPQNTFEKVALQSIDQGKIGNFIFDDQTNIFHIFLREVINQFVKLPQVRRFLLKEEIYRRILNYFSKQDRFKQNIDTTCTK